MRKPMLLLVLSLLFGTAPSAAQAMPAGQIPFASPDNPSMLNPALIWDVGQLPSNTYSLTEYPGKLTLISSPNEPLGPSVCYPVSGDFAAEVHVHAAPAADSQGGGLFVRVPGTWDMYTGIARSLNHNLHSIGVWGLYNASTPLPSRHIAYIAADADLRISREDGLLTLAYKGGAQRTWT